jgi:hypothetical protein
MEGYGPQRQRLWPAFILAAACLVAATAIVLHVRRQMTLLEYGRPATAVVTKVEKKHSDYANYWRVHYQWTLMSGGKRHGRYNHGKKQPPVVGARIPIVYDRDQPARNAQYPFLLVTLRK